MKFLTMALLGVLFVVTCGASSCEEKVAEKYGIKIKEDPPGSGQYKVIEDPAHGQIGTTVELVKDGTSGTPLAPVGAALAFGSSLLCNFLLKRAKDRAAQMTADAMAAKAKQEAANAQHEATHNATSLALQNFVNSHPPEIGQALIAHLDSVHDHMEVPAEHQDWIQPIQKT